MEKASSQVKEIFKHHKILRLKNFGKNLPFLMLSENLPDGKSYLEFPNGKIVVHEVFLNGTLIGTKTVRTVSSKMLTKSESSIDYSKQAISWN